MVLNADALNDARAGFSRHKLVDEPDVVLELLKMGLLFVPPRWKELDDQVCIQFAIKYRTIVVTNDSYKNHDDTDEGENNFVAHMKAEEGN